MPYGGCPTAALVPPPPPARLQPPCSGQGAAGHGLCRFLCFARAVGAETCLIFLFPGLSPDQVTGRETPCSVLCHGTRCATTHGPVDQLPPPPPGQCAAGGRGSGLRSLPCLWLPPAVLSLRNHPVTERWPEGSREWEADKEQIASKRGGEHGGERGDGAAEGGGAERWRPWPRWAAQAAGGGRGLLRPGDIGATRPAQSTVGAPETGGQGVGSPAHRPWCVTLGGSLPCALLDLERQVVLYLLRPEARPLGSQTQTRQGGEGWLQRQWGCERGPRRVSGPWQHLTPSEGPPQGQGPEVAPGCSGEVEHHSSWAVT